MPTAPSSSLRRDSIEEDLDQVADFFTRPAQRGAPVPLPVWADRMTQRGPIPQPQRGRDTQPLTPEQSRFIHAIHEGAGEPAAVAMSEAGEILPPQSWERIDVRMARPRPEITRTRAAAAAFPTAQPSREHSATGLAGLRGLIQSLAMLRPLMAPESDATISEPVAAVAMNAPVPPVAFAEVPRSLDPVTAAAPAPGRTTVPVPTVAPQPIEVTHLEEKPKAAAGAGRKDRREAFDDLEILPSWRGQYRKK